MIHFSSARTLGCILRYRNLLQMQNFQSPYCKYSLSYRQALFLRKLYFWLYWMVIKNEMFLIANSFQCFLLEVLSTKVLLFPREETSVTVSIKSWKGATIRVPPKCHRNDFRWQPRSYTLSDVWCGWAVLNSVGHFQRWFESCRSFRSKSPVHHC